MKSKKQKVMELEGELLRLNDLVRARRRQLEKLESCPNSDCECRAVWREVTERNLACQMGKVRKTVGGGKNRARPASVRSRKSR